MPTTLTATSMASCCLARKALKGPGYHEQCPNKQKHDTQFCGKHQACINPFITPVPVPVPTAAPVMGPRSSVVFENTTDFYNLESIDKIPKEFFYTYEENNHFYAFDITTLHDYLEHNKEDSGEYKNPYTNTPIPAEKVGDIMRTYSRVKKTGAQMDHYKETVVMSARKQLKWRSLSLFQHMNKLGHYADHMWFWQLTLGELMDMYDGLFDLWFYRIFLSAEQKQQILPNYMPFSAMSPSAFEQIKDINIARRVMLDEMTQFVMLGLDRDNQYTGSILVLTALVEVSPLAAHHMPFLVPDIVQEDGVAAVAAVGAAMDADVEIY